MLHLSEAAAFESRSDFPLDLCWAAAPAYGFRPRPNSSDTTNRTKKIKNRILAKPMAVPAMLVNPKIPAKMAISKNANAQFNIVIIFFREIQVSSWPTSPF